MITIFGVTLHKPLKTDILPIGLAALIGLLLITPLSLIAPPQTVFSWVCAGMTGAILSAMGVQARRGVRHIVLITFCCIPTAFLGHAAWLLISKLVTSSVS